MENKKYFTPFGIAVSAFLLVTALVSGLIFGFITSELKNFTGINNLKQFQLSVPTRLYDIHGDLIAEIFRERRELIGYDELPDTLVHAFVATEDQAFYDHFGINFIAIARAMVKNIQAGAIVQGGSTITQQLAKRLFTDSERTFSRKVLEAIFALQIEKRFSKEEILEMYFNQIYLGHGCYGIASASRLFFEKDPKDISAIESSILAALPSAPGRYSPLMNQHNAYDKNRDTLNRMVSMGYLTKEKANTLYHDFWPKFIESLMTEYPTKTAYTKVTDNAPYYTDYVRQILVSRFGKDVVYGEGLDVYTALDLRRQRSAQRALQNGVKDQTRLSDMLNASSRGGVDRSLFGTYSLLRTLFSLPGVVITDDIESRTRKALVDGVLDSTDLITLLTDSRVNQETIETFRSSAALTVESNLKVEGALISIEPKTGYISAMVGGSGFGVDNQYNRAVSARRQPGSAFKPFVYGAAIEKRVITPGTVIVDAPLLNIDSSGGTWAPGNYGGTYAGAVTVRHALAQSINIIAVRIYDMVGADAITDYASRMLKVPYSRISANPTMALGTSEFTPFEMAQAYAVYSNMGRDVVPVSIRFVLDTDGNEIANFEREAADILAIKEKNGTIQIISPQVAFVMVSMMRGVVDNGTATKAVRGGGFTYPAAGKTGTTSNWTDAWFCGYTPEISTVVWVGYDKPFLSLGKGMAGGEIAGPIWAKYMTDIHTDFKGIDFPPAPEGVVLVGDAYYLEGTSSGTGSSGGGGGRTHSIIQTYINDSGIN